jgi:hypothetical protein
MRCAQWIERDIPPGSARIALFNTIDLPLLRTPASLRENDADVLELARPWLRWQDRIAPESFADGRYELVTVPLRNPVNRAHFRGDLHACIDDWDADYVVIEVFTRERRTRFALLRECLQQKGRLAARFSPYDDSTDDVPFEFSEGRFGDYGWWTGHLLHAHGFGPVVEVYRLR